eukprot:TRINITY_DN17702_c0_g1_i1.p1 TRINITY_DN17702_c0_g1~~TRINITY_DN17702_c0_g1_i1.p1  ORF type:complete len:370 (-),score=26.86 TRINITY_DN17702_c0_g1_i1:112-1221(-)
MGSNYAAKIIHACGKLRFKNEDLLQALQKTILYDLDNDILLPRYLSTALWGASLVGYYPEGLCNAFSVLSDDFIAQFNLQNICNSLYALSFFLHYPSQELLDKMMMRLQYFVKNQDSEVIPQNLSDLMYALTRFQYRPSEELLQYIVQFASKNVEKFSTKQAYDLLLGLTVFGVYDIKLMSMFEDEMDFVVSTSKLIDRESLIGLYLVFLSYFQHYGDDLPDSFFQHPVTLESRQLWVSVATQQSEVQKKDPVIQHILNLLHEIQANCKVGYFDDEYEVCIDILVSGVGSGRCGLLIYREGEVFINDPDRRTGESVLIQNLIEQAGYQTAVINVRDWNLLDSDALRKMFLTQVLVSKGVELPQQNVAYE